jgi:DNA-binding Lrp family transcriptional regulator
MKNSRRTDRGLAKAIGVSQPTVSRLIKRLEKDGYIGEYTFMPNFSKLGFKIMAMTFLKLRKDATAKELEIIEKMGKQVVEKSLKNIMTVKGMGLGYDMVIVSVHEEYSSYEELVKNVKQFPQRDVESVESFLVNLEDKVQYRPLTFFYLAQYLSETRRKERSKL